MLGFAIMNIVKAKPGSNKELNYNSIKYYEKIIFLYKKRISPHSWIMLKFGSCHVHCFMHFSFVIMAN